MSGDAEPIWRDISPPAEALRWAASALGHRWMVTATRALHGGISHATHRLDCTRTGDGEKAAVVLRRWARPGWREDDPEFTAEHEAACLELIARAGIPAPRLLAVDPQAQWCDVPAVLQSLVPGAPPPHLDHPMLVTLATTLERIHAIDAQHARVVALPYAPYYELPRIEVPDWVKDAGLWRDALDAVAGDTPPPGDGDCFLHRDFHPGNTLWQGGTLAGVLDWDRGSWGSAAIDVAHMCWNLAVLHDSSAAETFVRDYRRASGRALADLAWWQVRDALDALPDVATEWGTPRVEAMERFVTEALRRMG